jgi:predicted RNA binding protein YcfA (HicA-like mRNA interferase family)
MKPAKTWEPIVAGSRDIRFRDFEQLLRAFGFELDRQSGSHRIYRYPKLRLRMKVQPEGAKAKLYQIRQLLELVETYGLRLRNE